MEKIFVSELEEGQQIYNVFQVKKKTLIPFRERQGRFLSLVLGDRTGTIDGKVWNKGEEIASSFKLHDFVLVKGTTSTYNQKLQLTIESLSKANIKDQDVFYFLPTSPRDVAEMWQELQEELATLTEPSLAALRKEIFADEDIANRFRRAPAAKSHHQAYLGGLLEHTLNVVQLARKIASTYEGVELDLLLTGALFHDIGKIYEFHYDKFIDYSDAGRLLGHITIGANLIADQIKKLYDFPENLRLKLIHLILSHHGKYEWQSPKRPKFLEGIILHQADYIDSQVDKFIKVKNNAKEETWPYERSLERYIFTG